MLCNSIDEECNKMYKDSYELVTYYFHPDYIYMTYKKLRYHCDTFFVV